MSKKYYRYSSSIKFSKMFIKGTSALMFLLFIYMLVNNRPSQYSTYIEYIIALFSPLIYILAGLLYCGAFSDVGVDSSGLSVEFVIWELQVPWESILEVSRVDAIRGVWLITANNRLTPIHRLYSIFSKLSFQPGFLVYVGHTGMEELVNIIVGETHSHPV